jgi:hypothetical protein
MPITGSGTWEQNASKHVEAPFAAPRARFPMTRVDGGTLPFRATQRAAVGISALEQREKRHVRTFTPAP